MKTNYSTGKYSVKLIPILTGFKKPKWVKYLIISCILSLFFSTSFSQVGISNSPITPNASSILELRSTTAGFLPPRMTTAERDAIASPATGLVIYNSSTNLLNFYNGSAWQITNTSAQNDLKVNISDTAAMLANYRTSYQPIGNYATTAQNDLKVNISDTAAMLTGYVRSQRLLDSLAAVRSKEVADSAVLRSAIALKVNISDTAAMLVPYAKISSLSTELTGLTNATPNSSFTDNKNYWSRVFTADGFPVTGFLTGIRKDISNVQRLQSETGERTFSRFWLDGSTVWSTWIEYIQKDDFPAKGVLLAGSGVNNFATLTPGADGTVLTADNTTATGLKWATSSTEITGLNNSTPNTSFADNKNYWSYVVSADGFPVTGLLTGIRKGSIHTQTIQSESAQRIYSRFWIDASTVWSTWIEYIQKDDFSAKGVLLAGSGVNSFNALTSGADGTVLTADNTTATGLKWASTSSEITGLINTTPNTSFADNKNYWSYVLATDGFPVTGLLTGIRKGIIHTQTIQSESAQRIFSRYWIDASTTWSTWIEYIQKDDFTAKGVLLAGSAANNFTALTAGADGMILTADNTTATGLKWAANNLKVNISDTAAMLANYRTSYQPVGSYATTAQNNLKVNISDTAAMLANYRTSYQPVGSYATTVQNNLKVNISDTAAMLTPYLRKGDTAAMLSTYLTSADLIEGNGIQLTKAAGTVTIAQSTTVFQASSNVDATTTSLTDVVLTGMTITPGAGDYLVFFTGSMENTNSDKQGTISIYKNGVQIPASIIQSLNPGNKSAAVATNAYITNLAAGQAIDIRWYVLSNTGTFHQRTLIVQRVK